VGWEVTRLEAVDVGVGLIERFLMEFEARFFFIANNPKRIHNIFPGPPRTQQNQREHSHVPRNGLFVLQFQLVLRLLFHRHHLPYLLLRPPSLSQFPHHPIQAPPELPLRAAPPPPPPALSLRQLRPKPHPPRRRRRPHRLIRFPPQKLPEKPRHVEAQQRDIPVVVHVEHGVPSSIRGGGNVAMPVNRDEARCIV